MSQTLIPAAVAGAAASALCFGFLSLMTSGSTPVANSGSEVAAVGPAPASAGTDLSERLIALDTENSMLSARVSELENLIAGGGGALTGRQVVGEEAVAALAPEELSILKQLAAATPSGDGTVPPALYVSVAQVVSDLEDQEREERDARRRELELERYEERLVEMRAELGLDDSQADSMLGYYMQRVDSREQILNEARESGDFAGIRDGMRESQDLYDTAIEGVLSPSQFATYQESFAGNNGRRGGGGGGGAGGFFGGGGRAR